MIGERNGNIVYNVGVLFLNVIINGDNDYLWERFFFD